jgi:hypothetical protein
MVSAEKPLPTVPIFAAPLQEAAVLNRPGSQAATLGAAQQLLKKSEYRLDPIFSAPQLAWFLALGGTNFHRIRAQQIRSNLIRPLWHADKIPLPFIAIIKAEKTELFGCLDDFGNNVDRKVSRKID